LRWSEWLQQHPPHITKPNMPRGWVQSVGQQRNALR
jgi:hypothetical protein